LILTKASDRNVSISRVIDREPKLPHVHGLVTIPQIFTWVRGPLAASAHEVDTAQVRVLIRCVFIEIVIESETYHIYRAILLTI
jgi:hypothetical protein